MQKTILFCGFLLISLGLCPQDPQHLKGLDLSVHSGRVDWDRFDKSQFHFVYLKATEGVDLADGAFKHHWTETAKRKIPRGAYHFYVTEDGPLQQAHFFIKTLGDDPGELPPVLDIELLGHHTDWDVSKLIGVWLKEVEKAYGVKPIIYTGPNFWNRNIRLSYAAYPLWVAEYKVKSPLVPQGWEKWTLWQYLENIPLPWVEKGADLSYFHVDFLHLIRKNTTGP